MRRPRPHIPLSVRVQVARRQVLALNIPGAADVCGTIAKDTVGRQLETLLDILFIGEKHQLDHQPALCLRPFNKRTGEYDPPANDPSALIYRTVNNHRIKTYVKGDGAAYSDTALRNRERKRTRKPKRKTAWKSRPWPKGRKLESRGFR